MRRFTSSVALVCTLFWSTVPAFAIDADKVSSGNIFGIAVTAEGSPVTGTPVELIDAAGKVLGQSTTDANGTYGFSCIPNGSYTMGLGSGDGETRRLLPALDERGLRVDWKAIVDMPSEAMAMVPTTGGVCGASAGVPNSALRADDALSTFVEANAVEIGAGVFVAAGLTVGGLALAGEFDDDDDDAPASPSR